MRVNHGLGIRNAADRGKVQTHGVTDRRESEHRRADGASVVRQTIMEMVVHQTVGMEPEMKAGDDTPKDRQKLLAVLVIEKDVLLRIPPSGDVIERPRKFDTERSGHGLESSSPVIQET